MLNSVSFQNEPIGPSEKVPHCAAHLFRLSNLLVRL
jgi:hypothetical protein